MNKEKLSVRRLAIKKQSSDIFCEEELLTRSEPDRKEIKTVSFHGGMSQK